jgi:penicillin-binding protein 1A
MDENNRRRPVRRDSSSDSYEDEIVNSIDKNLQRMYSEENIEDIIPKNRTSGGRSSAGSRKGSSGTRGGASGSRKVSSVTRGDAAGRRSTSASGGQRSIRSSAGDESRKGTVSRVRTDEEKNGKISAAGSSVSGDRKSRTGSAAGGKGKNDPAVKTSGDKASGKKGKKKKKHKKFWMGVKIFFLLILIAILVAIFVFYHKYGKTILQWQKEAKETIAGTTEETFTSDQSSIIYASDKTRIAELKGDKDSYYLTFDKIPDNVKNAFIDTEDRTFYEHKGIDMKAIFSAGIQLIRSKLTHTDIQRGGSTITQQLAKTEFLYPQQTYERKIREIFLAMEMEKKYSKKQILEFYINNVYFMNGYYGIEAASRGYFSKKSQELDLAQTAFLCSIPNSPTYYDPLKHYDHVVERKNRILKEMYEQKSITESEYQEALNEKVKLKREHKLKLENYMTTFAVHCATEALMSNDGFEFRNSFSSDADRTAYQDSYDELYNQIKNSLYSNGYKIYTSLNKKKQNTLQKTIDNALSAFTDKDKGIYKFQSAATCIDNKTGRVVAIVGGRSQSRSTGYTLNRAYQSYRQPGSSFKPIAVYTPALERGYNPNTIVDDSEIEDGPQDADGRFLGKMTLRTAVEKSRNAVAWRIFEELTPQVGLSYPINMDFRGLTSADFIPAASIGGLTHGVTTTNMASAYATIENGGVFRTPTCIVRIKDSHGNTVVTPTQSIKAKNIYLTDAAHMMTDILQGVLIRGTAAGHAIPGMSCAGKTGTTNDHKDGWFCGFTPYYTTSVWVGYDNPVSVYGLSGASYPLSIWQTYMTEIHQGLTNVEFDLSTENGPYPEVSLTPLPTETAAEKTLDPDALGPDATTEVIDDGGQVDNGTDNGGTRGDNGLPSEVTTPVPSSGGTDNGAGGDNGTQNGGGTNENTNNGANGGAGGNTQVDGGTGDTGETVETAP